MMRMLLGQLIMEMKLFVRDRSTVFWTFFFPVFLILLFGFVFDTGDAIRIEAGVADSDHSPASSELLSALSQLPVLYLHPRPADSLTMDLNDNRVGAGLFIPEGYQDSLAAGKAFVELRYHPEQLQMVQMLTPLLQGLVNQLGWEALDRRPPIAIRSRPVENAPPMQGYMNFLVPGLIGFSLMSTCLFSIGVVVVSYREKGKLRRLAVTPLPKIIFIGGQILNRYLVVLLQAILLIGIAVLIFEVRVVGSFFNLFVTISTGMFAFIALGYAVASVSKTPETASGIANVLFLPMTFFSGVYFSTEGLPAFLKPLV
nr:ABC transporter permease [Calditrichia bacterium]